MATAIKDHPQLNDISLINTNVDYDARKKLLKVLTAINLQAISIYNVTEFKIDDSEFTNEFINQIVNPNLKSLKFVYDVKHKVERLTFLNLHKLEIFVKIYDADERFFEVVRKMSRYTDTLITITEFKFANIHEDLSNKHQHFTAMAHKINSIDDNIIYNHTY